MGRTGSRVLGAAAAVAATAAGVLIGSSDAGAAGAVHAGLLESYGPGEVYTGPSHTVTLAATPGGTVTYHLKIINQAGVAAQYNLKSLVLGSPPASYEVVYNNASVPAVGGPGAPGWYTPVIAARGSISLTVRVATPVSTPEPNSNYVVVELYATDGMLLNETTLDTMIKPPDPGTLRADVYIRSGSQPFIGGSVSNQYETAPTITPTGKATYDLRLQNDSTQGTTVPFELDDIYGCLASFPVKVVTTGYPSRDVTAAFVSGAYSVTLAPGRHIDLTMTVTATGPYASCSSFSTNEEAIYLIGARNDPDSSISASYTITNLTYTAPPP